ncbi:PP2C family protein-serine/threonine phosphatase [Bifidobacterium saguinibicoloris]|uniref:PP2C family protein-serine/threonine phosphatase n=1 Tax=Bifidobacterium saguinibicoloris TaxID=2834433 RepID=UPI001C5896C4|nr:protein phosphatase 2C domain-containing protein [Bifidobacterium saguinibicoloris]MBW3081472.1 serine/threonine-protein phosphatase [Bifidobacterium saguinibicoloris]
MSSSDDQPTTPLQQSAPSDFDDFNDFAADDDGETVLSSGAGLAAANAAAAVRDPQDAQATQALSRRLFLYSTTVSDVGTQRANNQDSSFAGEHFVAICDGMGGHAGGDTASTIAIRSLAHIERDDVTDDVGTIASMMVTSVMAADDAIVGKARRESGLGGMGTTVTAVALVSDWWVLAHIGDSRAYLLRDGVLSRATQDHSLVQHLVDMGRITPSEAKTHPQKNMVMRVIGDFDIDPHPDVAILKAHPADRWLLCSDGLCGVLEDSTIAEVMSQLSDPGECAQQLVGMALRAGSTDNVTAVIADATLALDAHAFELPHQTPLVGGAASASLEPIADIVNEPVATAPALRDLNSPAVRAAALSQSPKEQQREKQRAEAPRVVQPSQVREENGERHNPDTGEIPVVQKSDGVVTADPNDPEVAKAIHEERAEAQKTARSRRRHKRIGVIVTILAILAVLAGGVYAAYRYSQSKYYVGEAEGKVAIYQGVPTNLAGFSLSHEVERTSISINKLPSTWRDELQQGIVRDNLAEAQAHVKLIRAELKSLEQEQQDAKDSSSASKDAASSSDSGSNGSSSSSSDSGASDDATGSSDTSTEEGGSQQ